MSEQFVTPVGRIVWGHPLKSIIKKDQRTKQPILRNGKQVEQWAFGVAFPKNEFNANIMPILQKEVATLFPAGVPTNFSWKLKDGDSVDRQGKPFSAREGYAGCWVLTISTEAFAPRVFKFENGAYREMQEAEVKTGDYVAVNLTVKANKPADVSLTPGLYVNPNGIEHIGYGPEIVSTGQDPEELFANVNRQLPPGASAVPVSSAPVNTGFTPPVPTTPPAQQYQQQLPPPAHDFINNISGQNSVTPPAQQYQQQLPPAFPGMPASR